MGKLTRAEAADKSGLEAAYLDRLIEQGIIRPDADGSVTTGDVRRAKMAETLERAGIGIEALSAGIRSGGLSLAFMDAPAYQRFATLSDDTFRQLSERTQLPLALLMLVREATGGAMAEPDDRVREDEQQLVPFIRETLAHGIQPRSLERLLRVMSDGMRRVAQTEGDAWRSDIVEPMLATGASVTELGSMAEGSTGLARVTDEALLAIWHAHEAAAWGANIISSFETILTDAGLLANPTSPPAICFLDITGYTALTDERGDAAAAELASSLNQLVGRTSVKHGGRPVKWLGDGVMVYFTEPGLGVRAALELVDGVIGVGLPPAHVGLHAGPILFQEGDYFGRTVNMAARIADYARPGEVLVTQEVVDESRESGCQFTEIGPVEFKGVPGAVRLYAAHRGT